MRLRRQREVLLRVFGEPSCRSTNRLEVGPDDGVADLCAAPEVLPHPGPHGRRRLAWNLVRRRRRALRPGKGSAPLQGEQTKDGQTDAQRRPKAEGHGTSLSQLRVAVVQTRIAEDLDARRQLDLFQNGTDPATCDALILQLHSNLERVFRANLMVQRSAQDPQRTTWLGHACG